MSHADQTSGGRNADATPMGELIDKHETAEALGSYLLGLTLATVLTIVSFFIARTTLVWQPSIPVALAVLAIAQMGVHLVFFLHLTTGADSTNNILALAFGLLIVFVVVVGSMWIVSDLNQNMLMPSAGPMSMRPQH